MTQTLPDHFKVVRLDQSTSREARSILYHSYRHEPLYQHLLNAQKPGYKQRVRATMREAMRLHFARNETVLGVVDTEKDRLLGLAFLTGPEGRIDISDQFMWRLKMFLTAGYEATSRYIRYFQSVQDALPEEPHRMLTLIGIHPDFQKQGLGRKIMESIHDIADKDSNSSGIFLDTGNSRYLYFYESLGYEKYTDVKIGDITETILYRPAPNKQSQAA